MLFRHIAVASVVISLGGLWGCNNGPGLTNGGGCPSGQMQCGAVCATVGTDPTNCGSCGVTCAVGQQCVSGACQVNCGGGATACRGPDGGLLCVNLQEDNDNCGACGRVCPGGQVCALGRCQETCAAGFTICVATLDGGTDAGLLPDGGLDGGIYYCANVAGDPNNCGGCGVVCGTGRACCSPTGTETGFTCIDVANDGNNCGACGRVCNGTGCSGGLCSPTTVAQAIAPEDPHVDSNNVYYVGSYSVIAAPLDGGAPYNLSAVSSVAVAMTIDTTNAYWSDDFYDEVWFAPLMQNPDGGTNASFLSLFPLPHDPVPYGLVTDQANIFCASADGGGTISRVSNGGSFMGALVTGGGFVPNGIAVDTGAAGYVYWTDVDGGGVLRTYKNGGSPVQALAIGQAEPSGIAVDSQFVYWTNTGNGTVVKRPLDGGSAVIIANAVAPARIAVDADSAYFTDHATGTVMKVPLDGGNAVTIAIDQNGPSGICLDANRVYWTDDASGSLANLGAVMSAPK